MHQFSKEILGKYYPNIKTNKEITRKETTKKKKKKEKKENTYEHLFGITDAKVNKIL